ncbi:multifunctional transcriptional regulator/nicotinamide-nucleotide adenylyltransferase/ribosylnicotinamide kinase NadR [Rossellomorea vietnamensis]|uniref:Multifunctional transcriptional regulator/nicotinamide-nucleotide adenylyltransferase/ribosylnicotinamide kinase NadR n=1 Tax=Rossellomorea vietnamensis TaxID=218284 RepID=A0A5D4MK07_9BACI|nr:multifunctional transcriptional regulator/nicotinamide-nucleotide adenylyltransferase/ribosylnicotinamide kinase NadR [Rossellomorea vietnamensis]TYS01316.1 multifunctional transcriptional regulator/nicotinamide-nucleotide adenylyltransferase/ribosylnicotinamide kinase NadR [Rossellomorea vietnamensis]
MKTVGFFGGKFLPLHQGHVLAIMEASSTVDELYIILSHSEVRDRKTCEKTDFPYIPGRVRLRWLHQLTKDMENVHVLSIEDNGGEDEYDWELGAKKIKQAIGKPITHVFSSEKDYDDIFQLIYKDSTHILIDPDRIMMPVSATKIRTEGVYANWNFIPKVVQPFFVKKVVILGTESCGKSTLTRNLAALYNTTFVEEYGRTLCEEIGGCEGIILEEDFPLIAYGHKMKEHQSQLAANKIMFIDTEATVTQFYSELYLHQHQKVINEIAKTQQYDLCLYLEPDVKWVNDGLRKHGEPSIRSKNDKRLKELLKQNGISYQIITGPYQEKLKKAINAVNRLLGVSSLEKVQ